MLKSEEKDSIPHRASPEVPEGSKRPYEPPRLVVYGDLRTLTLGPTPGIGESGNPALFRSR